MKKSGFTLTEVLLVLGVTGIVAALTIPTVVSESQHKMNASKLAAVIPTIENAFTTMMAAEGVTDFAETEFAQNFKQASGANVLGKYMKISSSDSQILSYYSSDEAPSIDSEYIYQMKSGALLFLKGVSSSIAENTAKKEGISITSSPLELRIDVNANQKPDIVGRDIFSFIVGSDGALYPVGGKVVSKFKYGNSSTGLYSNTNSKDPCSANKLSEGCTARLIENNFVVDY